MALNATGGVPFLPGTPKNPPDPSKDEYRKPALYDCERRWINFCEQRGLVPSEESKQRNQFMTDCVLKIGQLKVLKALVHGNRQN